MAMRTKCRSSRFGLRIICKNNDNKAIGLIDLFEYDPRNDRAGIGIVIQNKTERKQGFGKEALELLINYAFTKLNLHQLFANIGTKNEDSLQLFATFGFQKIGIKKDWNLLNGKYEDEVLFQLINNQL